MNNIFNSIEKLFRYFLPGFLFVFLIKLSFVNIEKIFFKNIGILELIIGIYAIGMLIFAFYRMLLTVILEPILFKANMTVISNFIKSKKIKLKDYPRSTAAFLKTRYTKTDQNLSTYLNYTWSIVHYMVIASVMLFIFTLISGKDSFIRVHFKVFLISSLIITLLSAIFLILMYSIEKFLIVESKK